MPALPTQKQGTQGPLLVLLHWLGGSTHTWTELSALLIRRGLRTAAIDLPGFGDANRVPGYTVREMADSVAQTIRSLRAETPHAPWLLAGHSMGGKLAAILTREALNGTPGLGNLVGTILISPSPASPEPMSEHKRAQLLRDLGHPPAEPIAHRKNAKEFLDANVGKLSLPSPIEDRSIDDIFHANPAAFRAWLEEGSREDCSAFVSALNLPAIILAGESESPLGPDTQREQTLPHFPQAKLIPLKATGHLSPLERPAELAEHIAAFAARLNLLTPIPAHIGSTLSALLYSEHTSPSTRAVLAGRLTPDDPAYTPRAIDPALFPTFRALTDTFLPDVAFDLAARADTELAKNTGDGWRPDALPADITAMNIGLRSLDAAAHHHHGVTFLALDPDRRHQLLAQATEGKLDPRTRLGHLHLDETAHLFTAAQMQHWFEETRSLLTRLYTAHPSTYDRINFTGFADDPAGFTHITLGTTTAHIPQDLSPRPESAPFADAVEKPAGPITEPQPSSKEAK